MKVRTRRCRIFLLIFMLVCCNLITACSSKKGENALAGKWEAVDHEGGVLNFNDDGIIESEEQNPSIEDSDFWINHIFHYADEQNEELLGIKKNGNGEDYIVEIENSDGKYISLWITKPEITADSFSGTVHSYATSGSFQYYPIKNSDIEIKKISSTEIEATINVPGKVEGTEMLQVYE